MGTVRLTPGATLESRDGTLTRDARMKNTLVEQIDGEAWAIKRPGVANATDVAGGAVTGQGMVALNGTVYAVFNDTIYRFAASTIGGGGGGGGSSGWVQI